MKFRRSKIENLENIKKYNTSRIDITNLMFSNNFTLSNYLTDKKVVALISLGVPCGAIQTVYKGKDISRREENELTDRQLSKIKKVYVPINSLEELAEHRATHFCSYTINPNYIEPKKVQSFMYRFELLTDRRMGMFDIDDINNHQIELLNDLPLTYKKLEDMKNKYITPEIERKYIEENKPRGLREKGFYNFLNGDSFRETVEVEEEAEF